MPDTEEEKNVENVKEVNSISEEKIKSKLKNIEDNHTNIVEAINMKQNEINNLKDQALKLMGQYEALENLLNTPQ